MTHRIFRRDFLRNLVVVSAAAGAQPLLAACSDPTGSTDPADQARVFPQGVASGDPKADSVILWTRIEPAAAGDGSLYRVRSFSTVIDEEGDFDEKPDILEGMRVAAPIVMACYLHEIVTDTSAHCGCNHPPRLAAATDVRLDTGAPTPDPGGAGMDIAALPDTGPPGPCDDYCDAVSWAQDFARLNRELMIENIHRSRWVPSSNCAARVMARSQVS